jgi:hypothetical protein
VDLKAKKITAEKGVRGYRGKSLYGLHVVIVRVYILVVMIYNG